MNEPDILPLESVPAFSRPVSAQRVVNAYAERQQSGAKAQWARYGSPGIVTTDSLGAGPVRGWHQMNGVLYCISGSGVYTVTAGGVGTLVASGVVGNEVVSIDDNGLELVILNGMLGWTYDPVNLLRQITSPFFYAANTGVFFDDYFFFDRHGTNTFFRSDLLDGQSYVFDNFISAEGRPDFTNSVRVLGNILYVLGESTIERFYDAGADDFPLRRTEGGVISRGCAAPRSVIDEDEKFFFLGNDRVFYQWGGGLQRMSNHAIETAWQAYQRVDDAFCTKYTWNGHKFINVNFPSANATWTVDLAGGKWHERESLDSQRRPIRWRANAMLDAFGKTWAGDYRTGKIGYLDGATYTEFDDPFDTYFITPSIGDGMHRTRMPWVFFDAESGVGSNTGQAVDPQWMLSFSDDGGRTFTPVSQQRGSGLIGETDRRMYWERLGSFYNRVLRIGTSDPAKRVAISLRLPDLRTGD